METYEQKYKEALERARMINNGKDVDIEAGTTTCEYIFPELQESEDAQNTWKPTKEQMYMLEWLTTNVLDDGVVGKKAKEVLNTLIEELKSL